MTKRVASKPKRTRTSTQEQEEPRSPETMAGGSRNRWRVIAGLVGALAIFLALYLLRLDRTAGLVVDDAWYIVLAKALATGQGYRLINSPLEGIFPLYPPAFPWLLSLVFRVAPEFPQNVWLLKSVSIVAMLGVGLFSHHYFTRYREMSSFLAFGVAFATATVPALVFLATSTVMSECVFTLSQLLTIIAVERCVKEAQSRRGELFAILAAVAAAFSFLTRAAGVGLLAGVFLYLLKERLTRTALIFAVGVALLAGPWTLYAQRNTPTPEQQRIHGGHIVQPYAQQFWQWQAGVKTSGKVRVSDLPERAWNNLYYILGDDIGGVVSEGLIQLISPNEMGSVQQFHVIALALSALAMIGFVAVARARLTAAEYVIVFSLTVTLLWPWAPFRFVLPLAPFLLFYTVIGLRVIFQLLQRWQGKEKPQARQKALGVAVGVIIALNLYVHVTYILDKFKIKSEKGVEWLSAFEEGEQVFKWVREKTSPNDVVVSGNPGMVYLYTGRKALAFENPSENWEDWKRLGVRYLVYAPPSTAPEPSLAEGRYNFAYRSSGALGLRVTDFGPPASRLSWGGVGTPPKFEIFK